MNQGSDGPSFHIKEGTERKGTYDALAFDGAADGIVLTGNFSKYLKNTSARVAYGTPNNGSTYNNSLNDTTTAGVFVDTKVDGLGKDNLVQVYHVMAKDFNANAAFGAGDKNIGDFDLSGAMLEVKDMNNFDFFVHYVKSVAKPNGQTVDLSAMGGSPTSGLMSSVSDTSKKSGNAIWLGTRYKVNKSWSVGAEYNKGSENWFSFTYGPNDPLNKLATRGTATEVYATYNINKNANIRAGVVNIDYSYTGSGSHLMAPVSMDSAMATGKIEKYSNGYVTFNVLF